jgi:hypothetical protein
MERRLVIWLVAIFGCNLLLGSHVQAWVLGVSGGALGTVASVSRFGPYSDRNAGTKKTTLNVGFGTLVFISWLCLAMLDCFFLKDAVMDFFLKNALLITFSVATSVIGTKAKA